MPRRRRRKPGSKVAVAPKDAQAAEDKVADFGKQVEAFAKRRSESREEFDHG